MPDPDDCSVPADAVAHPPPGVIDAPPGAGSPRASGPEAQGPALLEPSPGEPGGEPPAPPPQVTAVLDARHDPFVAGRVIEDLARVLADRTADFELLVVEDASGKGTASAVEEARTRHPAVRLIHRGDPGGYGDTLREALAEARFPLVLVMDRPCGLDAAGLEVLLAEAEHCHIVLSLRARPGGGLRRLLADWLLRAVSRVIFGIPLTGDRPVKLYRREIFDRIRIQSHGRFAEAEILAKAGFFGMLIGEVPIEPETVAPDVRATVPAERLRTTLRDAWRVFVHPLLLPPEERDLRGPDAQDAEDNGSR